MEPVATFSDRNLQVILQGKLALDWRWIGKLAAKLTSERRLGTELTVQLPLERRFRTHLMVKLALECRSWAPLNVKFAKKAIRRKSSFYLGKTMVLEVLIFTGIDRAG